MLLTTPVTGASGGTVVPAMVAVCLTRLLTLVIPPPTPVAGDDGAGGAVTGAVPPLLAGGPGGVALVPALEVGPVVLTNVAVGWAELPGEAALTPESWVSWLGVAPPVLTRPAAEVPGRGLGAVTPKGWAATDGFDNAEVMPGAFVCPGLVPRPTAISSAAAMPLMTPPARIRRRCVVVS